MYSKGPRNFLDMYLNKFAILLTIAVLGGALREAQGEDIVSCAGQKPISAASASALQQRVQNTYRGVSSLKAEFLQDSYLQALEVSETSSGVVAFARPGKMRWDYREPEEQQFIFADRTMWFYQREQNQVLIDSAEDVLLSDLPISFLLGIGDLSRDFNLISACARDEGTVLDLVPKQSNEDKKEGAEKGLKSFQLLIDTEKALPIGARVVDVGGNVTSVLLRNVLTNETFSSDLFAAKFPQGTDVQDRRKEKESA